MTSTNTDPSDKFIWNQFREGNQLALSTIYNAHFDALFQYGCKFTLDKALVKDAIQDLFVYIYNNHTSLGETDNIRLYLFRSLKRRIIVMISKSDIKKTNDLYSIPPELITYTTDGIDENQNMLLFRLKKALDSLPDRQKEVIYLRYNQGLSYEDICELTGLTYKSARVFVSRAIKKLRKMISQDDPNNLILLNLLSGKLI